MEGKGRWVPNPTPVPLKFVSTISVAASYSTLFVNFSESKGIDVLIYKEESQKSPPADSD